MKRVEVRDASQIAEARREAAALARRHGFGEEDAGRVAIVASELATNIVRHGDGGELLIGSFDDETGAGIECIALDRGPGMADVPLAVHDGYSTGGSSGNGLGAVIRGSHYSGIYSTVGAGSAILARLKAGRPPTTPITIVPRHGSICLPIPGEERPGDGWGFRSAPAGATIMVVDGLGHGPLAADAARAASRVFGEHQTEPPSSLLKLMDGPLRSTRGAAVSIAEINMDAGSVVFAGVGNVAGAVVGRDGTVKRMVSHNGTLGHVVKRFQEFTYSVTDASLVILCSDGLGTGWSFDRYPALMQSHPSLIAAVLYRDYTRGRDDVTVVVVRADSV